MRCPQNTHPKILIPKSQKKKKKIPCPTQKIHTTTKIFHTHTHKNLHVHEIRPTHSNKISSFIKNEFVQPCLHINFLWFQYPQHSSQDSSNNTINYIQCQASWVINIVQVSYQIIQQFKNASTQRIQHHLTMISNQIIQCSKFQQEQTTTTKWVNLYLTELT